MAEPCPYELRLSVENDTSSKPGGCRREPNRSFQEHESSLANASESDPVEEGGEAMSKVERIKSASNHLRGSIASELGAPEQPFTEDSAQLLKFHGVYQQDDRDRRREARARGLDKHWQMMIRTRIPGGLVSPEGYLAHDQIADRWGNGTIRVTTRQAIQLHGILKGDLRSTIRALSTALMTSLGGCGDQEAQPPLLPGPRGRPLPG